MARRALYFVNRHSRRGRDGAAVAEQCLAEAGIELVPLACRKGDDLSQVIRARAAGCDAVILGGGDGTMNAAAAALVETGLPLGILPLGTANDLARTLGLPTDPAEAAAIIADGSLRRIDLGQVNDRHFFNVASLGLSVKLTRSLSPEIKRRWGRLGYLRTAFGMLPHRHRFHAEIQVEDGSRLSVRTAQIAVGNGRYYGGGMAIHRTARIDDGRLDLYSLEMASAWTVPLVAMLFASGRQGELRDVRTLRSTAFTITTDRPRPINTDGEITTATPARFSLIRSAVAVYCPASQENAMAEDKLLIDDRVALINVAIAQCRDAVDDFRDAAGRVADPALTRRLAEAGERRADLLHRLEEEVRHLGELPDAQGTSRAMAARIVGAIRTALIGEDDGAILADLEAREAARADRLPDPRGADLPTSARHAIEDLRRITEQERVSAST